MMANVCHSMSQVSCGFHSQFAVSHGPTTWGLFLSATISLPSPTMGVKFICPPAFASLFKDFAPLARKWLWRKGDKDERTCLRGNQNQNQNQRKNKNRSHVPRHVLGAPNPSPHYFQLFYNSVILILLAFFSIFSKKRNTYVFPVFVCDITHNE